MPEESAAPVLCRHCRRQIIPTKFGTWQDKDNPGYEVCDLMDETGPSHEPEPRFVPLSARMTEVVHVDLTVTITPELAARFRPHLLAVLEHCGDMSDDGWDAHTASLSALVARVFDRQESPLQELYEVSGDDLIEHFNTFASVLP